jgi:putative restriction endonuclease
MKLKPPTTFKSHFEDYLYENNTDGSGKASSYLKSLEWLRAMLDVESYGFSDCKDIWAIQDVSRIQHLRDRVLEEKRKQSKSLWVNDSIRVSYLRDGYCSSALAELIEFIPQFLHSQKVLEVIKQHTGDASELAAKLNFEPNIPEGYVHDSKSQDGKDRIAEAKVRIGQQAFRQMILRNYNDCCCVTGLDIRTVNRASHIIGWADPLGKKIRLDPRNGLCLSATYDAAFDKHLISLDDDYRIILSKEIKEHTSSESLQTYFLNKEGDAITLPDSYLPKKAYLEVHRGKGAF